jgi:hypothetical protein
MECIMAAPAQTYTIFKGIAQLSMCGVIIDMMADKSSLCCSACLTRVAITIFHSFRPLARGKVMPLRPTLIASAVFVARILLSSIAMVAPRRMQRAFLSIARMGFPYHAQTMTLALCSNDCIRLFGQPFIPWGLSLSTSRVFLAFDATALASMRRLIKDIMQPCRPHRTAGSTTCRIITPHLDVFVSQVNQDITMPAQPLTRGFVPLHDKICKVCQNHRVGLSVLGSQVDPGMQRPQPLAAIEVKAMARRAIYMPFWVSMYRWTTSRVTAPTDEMNFKCVQTLGRRFFNHRNSFHNA